MGTDISKVKGNRNALKRSDMQSMANFSPGYIMKLKQRFENQSQDYNLTKQGLKEFFKCSDRECEVLFEMFDSDGNGSIDSYEFVCALSLMSHATLDEKAELIFNLYDFDKSQSISKDELTILMTNSLTAMKNMEGKPPPSIAEIEQKTTKFFNEADVDNDNVITLKEFKRYLKKDKQVLEVLCSFGVAQSEDLGTDFGTGESDVPDLDSDLEEEINPGGRKDKPDPPSDPEEEEEGLFSVEKIEGDQMLAVKPFLGVIKNSVPTGYKPSKRDGAMPEAELDLEYVFGYRCHDVRNNLRYTADGRLVYHAAGVGVVMDQKKNIQQHYLNHTDDIHCLALDPTGTLVATGEIGVKPLLAVWNCLTMQEMHLGTSQLTKGIMHVAWSKDGRYLAASDHSDEHCIAIFDMQAKVKSGAKMAPIAFGKGSRSVILSLGFNSAGNTVIATCVRAVTMITWANGLVKAQNCTGWGTQGAEAVLSQATIGDTTFTGTLSGEIIAWNGRSLGKRNKAHTGKVNALAVKQNGKDLMSGGRDGLVKTWSVAGGALTPLKQYDLKMPEIMSMNPQVRSVCDSKDGTKILIGTRGGEIVEFNENRVSPLLYLRSHFDDELWALAPHPTRAEIYTFGRDAMLAVWDLTARRQTKHCKLQCGGDALAFSNGGDLLVLGFNNGQIMVLDINFNAITKRCDKREGKAISQIKFSPNDAVCAVGAMDSNIFTYDVKQKFKPMKRLRGHHSRITHLDFSQDGAFLMSNSSDYEILFWDVAGGKQMTSGASMLRDEPWKTWSCTIGWPVQGIMSNADGTDINACERSQDCSVIATADDFGKVKLFSYPSPTPKATFKSYNGHSSHVTNITFTRNNKGQVYLVTTGGLDKCIFQWSYHQDKEAAKEADLAFQAAEETKVPEDPFAVEDADVFEVEEVIGDERGCVDTVKGQVMNSYPSGFKKNRADAKEPNTNLILRWAHGYRSFDTFGNLKYTRNGNVVFTTAGLGVVQDVAATKQDFFNRHKEDVVAMALHPEGDIVATGQEAGKAINERYNKGKQAAGRDPAGVQGKLVDIHIWRASDPKIVLATLRGVHRRAVRQLAFSPDGSKLLSIGCDDKFTAVVYDWANSRQIAQTFVNDTPISCAWKSETEFSTCGVKHLQLYTLSNQNIKSQRGCYITKIPGRGIQMTSVAYVLDTKQLVSGVSNGSLCKWSGSSCGAPIKAHSGPVYAIMTGQDNSFWTGGDCGTIKQWSSQFTAVKTFDLRKQVPFGPGVRSMDMKSDGNLLVGTFGSSVIEVSSADGKISNTITQGHFRDKTANPSEVWGCCVHPTKQLFASSGGDKTIRIWSQNKMIKVSTQFAVDITALDWCGQDAKYIVAGDRKGCAYLLSSETLEVLGQSQAKTKGWIEDIKFSPDGQLVAFGTHLGASKLTICQVGATGKLTKKGDYEIGISSALTHLDWTRDSQNVVINSPVNLTWFNVESHRIVNASSTKDFDYATWSCYFGFPVQGIWQSMDYSDTNTVDRSHTEEVIATGGDDGVVRLFKYPCYMLKAENKQYDGHSSHVTKVKFSANDEHLITTGGKDMTLLVWETDLGAAETAEILPLQVEETRELGAEAEMNLDDPTFESVTDRSKLQRADDKKNRRQTESEALVKKVEESKEAVGGMFEVDAVEGDEFGCNRPWLGAIKAPDNMQKASRNQTKPPPITLELDWVYGYRGSKSRNSLNYLKDGTIAYFNAGVGIMYNPETHTQQFFKKHTDDINCIAFHPDGVQVATGENGRVPMCHMWDGLTSHAKANFKRQGIIRNIQCVGFSPSGNRLGIVDESDDHNIAVYDTKTYTLVCKTKGDRGSVRDMAFKDDDVLVTTGPGHFKQWTIGTAGNFEQKSGIFGTNDNRHVGCVFNGNTCLTGSMLGHLYMWNGTNIQGQPKKLHERIIESITVTSTHIFTGARDSKINILQTSNYALQFSIDTSLFAGSVCPWPRAIAINAAQNSLMVGTFGHEVYEVPLDLKNKTSKTAIQHIAGHFAPLHKDNNEVWGLTVFNTSDKAISVGDDGTLRVWDCTKHKQIKVIHLNLDLKGQKIPVDKKTKELSHAVQGRCVDISPRDDLVVVGMRDGTVRLYKTANWSCVAIKRVTQKWIEDIKFSPDGKFIAVGSHDTDVHILSASPQLELFYKANKASGAITHIDWSEDSNVIRTNDNGYELLFYNVLGKAHQPGGASSNNNEPWATASCVLTWATQGIWERNQDGSDINHTDRSRGPVVDDMQLLATANDSGKVNVFRYPCSKEGAKPVVGTGHSSHVTKVRFTRTSQLLMSTGGNDTAVMQWSVQ